MKDADEFWQHVRRGPAERCWIWTRGQNIQGYGYLHWRGRTHMAHRIAWELTHGPIEPAEMTIDHLCLVKSCQNPGHMQLVTRQENGRRGHRLSLAWLEPRWETARRQRAEREAAKEEYRRGRAARS